MIFQPLTMAKWVRELSKCAPNGIMKMRFLHSVITFFKYNTVEAFKNMCGIRTFELLRKVVFSIEGRQDRLLALSACSYFITDGVYGLNVEWEMWQW